MLVAALEARFPQTIPYGGSIPVTEVVPHFAVAHAPNAAELEDLRTRFTAQATPQLPLAGGDRGVAGGRWLRTLGAAAGVPSR